KAERSFPMAGSTVSPQTLIHVPLDQRAITAVGVALKQGFRIEACDHCGGPKMFSKIQPVARCLRCGTRYPQPAVREHKTSWRRCALCHEPDMAGVPLNRSYCRACSRLSRTERAKRLRW